jgi:transposase
MREHSVLPGSSLGSISKMGNGYLRHLLVVGATAIVRYARRTATTVCIWANRLLERKPVRLVTVAVAHKMARIAWAVMTRQETYRSAATAA